MRILALIVLVAGCSARQITDEDVQRSTWARKAHETVILIGFKQKARMAGFAVSSHQFVEFTCPGYCRQKK